MTGTSAREDSTPNLSNKLLVLIDGRTVYSPLFSGVFWDAQNVMLGDLDRIEVISGPGGTFGARTRSTASSISLPRARKTPRDGIWRAPAARNCGIPEQFVTAAQLAPDVYYRVYGTYFDRNDEVFDNGTHLRMRGARGMGGFRIDTAGAPDDKFTAAGRILQRRRGHCDASRGTDVQSGGHVLGRWTHTFSSDSDMSLQMYYDRTYLSTPDAAGFRVRDLL